MSETVSEKLRRLVTMRARGLCEYCRTPENFAPERFSLEHIQPRAVGGPTSEGNLALACQGCNSYKSVKTTAQDPETKAVVPLFDPRRQRWREHFAWRAENLEVEGLTATGRATVALLRLNRSQLCNLRYALSAIQRHPPNDDE